MKQVLTFINVGRGRSASKTAWTDPRGLGKVADDVEQIEAMAKRQVRLYGNFGASPIETSYDPSDNTGRIYANGIYAGDFRIDTVVDGDSHLAPNRMADVT